MEYKGWEETFQSYKKFSWLEIDWTRNIPVCTERVNTTRFQFTTSSIFSASYFTELISLTYARSSCNAEIYEEDSRRVGINYRFMSLIT